MINVDLKVIEKYFIWGAIVVMLTSFSVYRKSIGSMEGYYFLNFVAFKASYCSLVILLLYNVVSHYLNNLGYVAEKIKNVVLIRLIANFDGLELSIIKKYMISENFYQWLPYDEYSDEISRLVLNGILIPSGQRSAFEGVEFLYKIKESLYHEINKDPSIIHLKMNEMREQRNQFRLNLIA